MEKPDLYVLAKFLDIMHHKGAIRRTNIQMLLGLNYSRFTEYFDWVLTHALVVEITEDKNEDNIGKFVLTIKGITAYNRLTEVIREVIEGVKI